MPATRRSLSPLAALGIGIVLIAFADVLGVLFSSVSTVGIGGPGPLESLLNTASLFVRNAVFAAISLGGIFAALTLERFDRPLLVVVPIVFGVAFLFVAVTGVLFNPFSTSIQLFAALSSGLSQAALVAAVTMLVRAIGVNGSDKTVPHQSLVD